jgi:response regulator of citrate/malate metabolism
VDDDPRQAELMSIFSRSPPHFRWIGRKTCTISGNIAAAPYDLILMDYRLPDGTGLEALEEIPKRGYHIRWFW